MALQNGRTRPDPCLLRAESPAEALALQEKLRHGCTIRTTIRTGEIRCVAGADAAYGGDRIYAAVAVLTYPALEVVEKECTVDDIPFPYIPGLLAFREGPAILAAYSRLRTVPDLLLLNGHGYAHPKRFGFACHIGLVLAIPSIGLARRLMTGTAAFPGEERGAAEPILDGHDVIGMAVRTVPGAKPVFVSAGHGISLEQAVAVVLATTRSHHITEPLWQADRVSRQFRDRNIRRQVQGVQGHGRK